MFIQGLLIFLLLFFLPLVYIYPPARYGLAATVLGWIAYILWRVYGKQWGMSPEQRFRQDLTSIKMLAVNKDFVKAHQEYDKFEAKYGKNTLYSKTIKECLAFINTAESKGALKLPVQVIKRQTKDNQTESMETSTPGTLSTGDMLLPPVKKETIAENPSQGEPAQETQKQGPSLVTHNNMPSDFSSSKTAMPEEPTAPASPQQPEMEKKTGEAENDSLRNLGQQKIKELLKVQDEGAVLEDHQDASSRTDALTKAVAQLMEQLSMSDDEGKGRERRKFRRVEVDIKIEAISFFEESTQLGEAHVLNLSSGGALLVTKVPVNEGDSLHIPSIFLPNGTSIKDVFAKSVHLQKKEGRYLIGVEFMYLDDKEKKLLDDFIDAVSPQKSGPR